MAARLDQSCSPWPAEMPKTSTIPDSTTARFNVAYWRKFDAGASLCSRAGHDISLVLDMNDSDVHPAAGSADEQRFIRYAVARFGAFSNITWDLGDDLDGFRNDRWTHDTGTLIKQWDPYRHLATSHPMNNDIRTGPRTGSISRLFRNGRETSTHSCCTSGASKDDSADHPADQRRIRLRGSLPVLGAKPDADSADTLRRSAWEIVMAGGYQTSGETHAAGPTSGPIPAAVDERARRRHHDHVQGYAHWSVSQ